MNEYPQLIKSFFQAYDRYFWKWSDDFEYIELFDETTICLREELVSILKELAPDGLIRLGPVLLTLFACQESRTAVNREQLAFHLKSFYRSLPADNSDGYSDNILDSYVDQNIFMIGIIRQLPAKYRSHENKILLIKELFQGLPKVLDQNTAPSVTDEFSGRNHDSHITRATEMTRQLVKSELSYLFFAIRRYPDVKSLEMKLRTGIVALPVAPEIKEPEPLEEDLLEALSKDSQTEGLARLTNRIIAALHIPIHTRGSSDQSYGGVSDITNRGNFDRLLLSELAQDDEVLTARLVNNEALYLRREEPPVKRERQRTILIDTSIRMWGLPRVFAVSAAIACSYKIKNVSDISFFAMGEREHSEIELHTRRGVLEALELLDAGLDSSVSLKNYMDVLPANENVDSIYICEESFLKTQAYNQMVAESKSLPRFFITINRNGLLVFYQTIGKRLKVISNAVFNLEELFYRTVKRGLIITDIPLYLQEETSKELKLYFPSTGMRLGPKHCMFVQGKGLFGITEINRLMFWPSQNSGARELIPFLQSGTYWFGYDGSKLTVLVTNTSGNTYLYRTDENGNYSMVEIALSSPVSQVGYSNGVFYVFSQGLFIIDAEGKVTQSQNMVDRTAISAAKSYKESQRQQNFKSFKRHINNGYTTIQRVGSVGISERGTLVIDNRELNYDNGCIKFSDIKQLVPLKKKADGISKIRVPGNNNPFFSLTCFCFDNGSKIYIDSRGFIHLVSHDTMLPEITLPFILGRSTAAYTSPDGEFSGSDYFIPVGNHKNKIEASPFYHNYIDSFIKKVLS